MGARAIHPFPARMAPEIALNAIPSKDTEALTVLDPMCGSGTVLAAALQKGHDAIGIDIDPLAVMMSRLTVSGSDFSELEEIAAQVVASSHTSMSHAPWGEDDETERFVDYWFGPVQKSQLIALSAAIASVQNEATRLALQVAVSRIIVTKSPQASLAADTAHSRPHRVVTSSDYDVMEGFRRSTSQLAKMLQARDHSGSGSVLLGDARTLESIPDSSISMSVTSPPYLNALDYLRGHKLALVWFGHSIADLRARRSASIGAERAPDEESSDVVSAIVDLVEGDAVDKTLLKRPMLERFAHDCVGFAAQLHRTLVPSGDVVLVVGNSTLRGNYIRNDRIAQHAMESMGFEFLQRYEREIPPSKRYMAIRSNEGASSITKRMRTEVVLTMRRAA